LGLWDKYPELRKSRDRYFTRPEKARKYLSGGAKAVLKTE